MSSLQIKIPPTSFSSSSQKRPQSYNATINVQKLERVRISLPKKAISSTKLVHQFNGSIQTPVPSEKVVSTTSQTTFHDSYDVNKLKDIIRLYVILKTVADGVEMHNNIGKQLKNWNCLLLNCIKTMMVHLKAAIMYHKAPKLTSILLLASLKGMLLITNKIRSSKRNATRLSKKLEHGRRFHKNTENGWSPELEKEMRMIRKRKDMGKYERLGSLALKITKTVAILGPWLTGIAAIASALERRGLSWAGIVVVMSGSLKDFIKALSICTETVVDSYMTQLQQHLKKKDYEKGENGLQGNYFDFG